MRILVSNLKQSVLKSTTKHYDYNYRKIKHHSLKKSKQEVSVKKDPPQSRSVDMVEVRNPAIQVSSDDPKVQSDNRDPIYEVLDQLKQMNSFLFRGPVKKFSCRPNFLTPPSFKTRSVFPNSELLVLLKQFEVLFFNVEGLFDKLQDKEFTQVMQSYDYNTG